MIDIARSVPRLEDYFGVWSIAELQFRAMVERFNSLSAEHLMQHLNEGFQAAGREPEDKTFGGLLELRDGVAIVSMSGMLMKVRSSFGGTSTVDARRAIRFAIGSADVSAIMLRIDSPGGTVAGTAELAADVRRAAQSGKPTVTYFEDLGASAAYWIGSQAGKVYANATALVGSIGTFAVLQDTSKMAERLGVQVHVVRAGEFKGAGTPGTVITDQQLAEFQRTVTSLNDAFIDGVAAGRNLTRKQAEALADGRLHVGQQAVAARLIDAVASFDDVFQNLTTQAKQEPTMTTTTAPTTNQTIQPPAPPAMSSGVPTGQSLAVYQRELRAMLDSGMDLMEARHQLNKRRPDLVRQMVAEANANRPAAHGQSTAAVDHVGAIAQWASAIADLRRQGHSLQQATRHLVVTQPDLHRAYLAAWNEKYNRRR